MNTTKTVRGHRNIDAATVRATNYGAVKAAARTLTPFKHTTCSAQWVFDGIIWVYVVRSYQTPVAWVEPDCTLITERRYSVTTTKQVNYLRHALPEHGWAGV